MNKEEILKVIDKGLESLLKEPNEIQQAFSNGCRYTMNVFQSANKYWEKVEQENQELKDRIDNAFDVINTQMKNADEGTKENLRIIKFNLIKGSCTFEDLKTEEDYKY